jgi:hypothetical protein
MMNSRSARAPHRAGHPLHPRLLTKNKWKKRLKSKILRVEIFLLRLAQ